MNELYDRQKSLELDYTMSVSVIGCGGVGYWVAKYLAMSGIEKLYLFDPDVLEESNLNRIDLPVSCLGMNKADATGLVINDIRPMTSVICFPFKYLKHTAIKTTWVIDCTDKIDAQILNQEIAHGLGCKYVKAGYDGTRISVSDCVGEWGESAGGYTVIPSWVVPASIVAAMTVAKVMKFKDKELSADISRMFIV